MHACLTFGGGGESTKLIVSLQNSEVNIAS